MGCAMGKRAADLRCLCNVAIASDSVTLSVQPSMSGVLRDLVLPKNPGDFVSPLHALMATSVKTGGVELLMSPGREVPFALLIEIWRNPHSFVSESCVVKRGQSLVIVLTRPKFFPIPIGPVIAVFKVA